MTYKIEIFTGKASTIWTNGGIGYTKEELDAIIKRLATDSRVTWYKVIENK